MIIIPLIVFFLLGIIIGSFLNVVILRYGTHKNFGGRSACMSCQNQLKWHELVPLFSYLFLKGRCSSCKTKISAQYFWVELATGLIYGSLFLKFADIFYGNTLIFAFTYAFYVTVFSLLMVITVYDIKHKIIPDALAVTLGIMAFVGLFLFSGHLFYPHIPSIGEFLSGFLISIPFALLWLLSGGRLIGLGDAKLAVGLGWLLGISRMLSGTVVAFWAGAIIGVALLIFSKKHGMKSEIPFAPFLILGSFIAFLLELHIFSFNY